VIVEVVHIWKGPFFNLHILKSPCGRLGNVCNNLTDLDYFDNEMKEKI
jgi:hypothetical protein